MHCKTCGNPCYELECMDCKSCEDCGCACYEENKADDSDQLRESFSEAREE